MENSVTRTIAMEARQKFVNYITTSVNTLSYIHNATSVPETDGTLFLSMEMLGLCVGEVKIPANDPNYMDDEVVGVYMNDNGEVSGFAVEGYDVKCSELSLNALCAICSQFEFHWRSKY
jgi:hypothetical protein